MSLTTADAVEAVRKAQKEEAEAKEIAVRAEHTANDALRDLRSAQMNLQEAQRVLLEVISEEEDKLPTTSS